MNCFGWPTKINRKRQFSTFTWHGLRPRQKDRDQALELLRRYLQTGDSEAGTAPYELLLELRGQQNEADQALAELEQLAQQQDQNVFLVYFLGEAVPETPMLRSRRSGSLST